MAVSVSFSSLLTNNVQYNIVDILIQHTHKKLYVQNV